MDRTKIDAVFKSGEYSAFAMGDTRELDRALVEILQQAERDALNAGNRVSTALITGDDLGLAAAQTDLTAAELELRRSKLRRKQLDSAFDRERVTDPKFSHSRPEYYRHPA